MLRKKEYTAILESANSKDEIVALFNSLYSPVPAIRIVREIYHRNADREYEFSCDKCGHGFVVKAENDPEYNEELLRLSELWPFNQLDDQFVLFS